MDKLASRVRSMLIAAVALAACGGGGGNPGSPGPGPEPEPVPPPAINSVNVAAAWHNFLTVQNRWTMPGRTADGRAFERAIEMQPGLPGAFVMTGVSGQSTAQSVRFVLTGANTVTSNAVLYFNNDNIFGIAVDDGHCQVPRTGTATLPGASAAGTVGALYTVDGYAGCTLQGQRLGAITLSWAIQAEADMLMFCLVSQQQGANGISIGSETHCIEASAGGILGTRAKFHMTMRDGSTLSGRNF